MALLVSFSHNLQFFPFPFIKESHLTSVIMVAKLTITYNVLCEGNVNFVLGSEDLNVLRHIRTEVSNCPGSQNSVLVGGRPVVVIPGCKYEAGFGRLHSGPDEIARLQCRALNVDDPIVPSGRLEHQLHGCVQLAGRQENNREGLQQRVSIKLI